MPDAATKKKKKRIPPTSYMIARVGMPEWGMMPIPKKLLKKGVRDMVRISDARMSGTSYGACILHVAPESYIGGPLSLLETGDIIELEGKYAFVSRLCQTLVFFRNGAARSTIAPHYSLTFVVI